MRTSTLLLLLLAVAGCSDTTAPPPELFTAELPKGDTVMVVESTQNPAPPGEDPPHLPIITPRSQWTEAHTVADSLGRIGVAAVPDLLAVINDRTEQIELRRQAVSILGRIGPPAAEVPGTIPALEAALTEDDEQLRKAAAAALGQMGPAASAAVPELMQILRTEIEEAHKESPEPEPESPVEPSR